MEIDLGQIAFWFCFCNLMLTFNQQWQIRCLTKMIDVLAEHTKLVKKGDLK